MIPTLLGKAAAYRIVLWPAKIHTYHKMGWHTHELERIIGRHGQIATKLIACVVKAALFDPDKSHCNPAQPLTVS